MAFGARNIDGVWRLCERKGVTHTHFNQKLSTMEIRFKSQAKTKACADELNERCWDAFRKIGKLSLDAQWELAEQMMGIIMKHGGITQNEFLEIFG